MNKTAEIIIKLLEETKMSQNKLSEMMGEDVRYLNQQINRQKDFKFQRFSDILEYLGFRIEIVFNDGIKKISRMFAMTMNFDKTKGLFWYEDENDYVGIVNTEKERDTEHFGCKEDCLNWLQEKAKTQ